MLHSLLPLFISCTITEFCVTSSLAFDNWGQKYCEILGHKPLLAMNNTEKGQWPVPMIRDKNIHTVCCEDNYFPKGEFKSINNLFQCGCFLVPICLPCVSCGTYWHSRRLACLRSHVLRACCILESKRAISITLFGRGPNKKRLQYFKFWLHGGQRLKLFLDTRRDLDGCPLHFWPPGRRNGTVNSFQATCTRCKQKKKLQSLSFILLDDHKWSIFDFFCYVASEPTLAVVVAKPKYIANFHTTNHVRSGWPYRLIRQLRVWPDELRLCRVNQNKYLIIPRID